MAKSGSLVLIETVFACDECLRGREAARSNQGTF